MAHSLFLGVSCHSYRFRLVDEVNLPNEPAEWYSSVPPVLREINKDYRQEAKISIEAAARRIRRLGGTSRLLRDIDAGAQAEQEARGLYDDVCILFSWNISD